jgi:hypothetical protein
VSFWEALRRALLFSLALYTGVAVLIGLIWLLVEEW